MPRTIQLREIMPSKRFATLKYCSSKSYSTGASGITGSAQIYALNGLYDPDVTGVGHQPYGYDQLMTFYDIYTVRSVQINFTIVGSEDPGNFIAWLVKPYFSGATIASSTLESVSEVELSHFAMLNPSTSAVPSQQIRLPRINLPTLEGMPWESFVGNNNYRAANSGNPSYTSQLHVALGNASGLATKTATIITEIYFDGFFESRTNLPQS